MKNLFRPRLLFLSLLILSGLSAQGQMVGPGSALSLDGASGCIQVNNGVWFSGNFTVEGWVFVRSYNNGSRLFDFANGPNTNNVFLGLTAGTTGFPVFGVYTNNNATPSIQSSTQLPLNQWVHLAATLNGTLGTLYMNGIAVASGTLNLPPNVVRTSNYFGRSNYPSDSYANATFDELRIWNVARTQAQIQADLHRSLVGNEPGLIGYWRMDEGSGTTLADSSGQGQTATLLGATAWSSSTAPLMAGGGSALNFNSTGCQNVQIPHQAALNAYPLTVMTWFMVPTNSNGGALVNKYVSSSLNGYQIFLSGDLKAWYFRDSVNNVFNNGVMDAGPVNDGQWHHAALAVDAAGGRLYLDGVLKSSVAWSGTPGAPTTSQPLAFGMYPGDSCFSGQLDEVSLWNTALSTAQIQSAMNHPMVGGQPGLIGYWRLDEGSGTTTTDSSGQGNNGTLQSSPPPAWIASAAPLYVSDPGYALHFNGTNSYADFPGFASVIPTNEITIEFWQRVQLAQNQSTLSAFPDSVTDRINVHVPWSDGNVYWDFGNINTAGRLSYTPSNAIVGTWQHFAFVASQSGNYMAIYQNGVQVAYKSGMTPFTSSGQHLILGAIPNGVYFNGDLDEVRIWNVARSAAQISSNFKSTLIGNEAGLVAYYRLDEGTGTTTVDATCNGANGTLLNNPTWLLASEPAGGVLLLGGNISTSGGQVYTSRVVLTNDTVLTSTGAGSITFASAVDGPYSLTVNTAGTTAFNGPVGSLTALASLSTDAAGTTLLNGGSVTTTGPQAYGDPITLGTGTTLTSTAAGNITFGNTVDGAFALTLNTSGTTRFNGPVGGFTPLASLSTGAAGTTVLNGGSVTTAGSQTYGEAVQLGFNNTVTSTGAGNITFGNALDGDYSLTMNTAGTNTFNGPVGGFTPLTSLTIDAAGTTVFNGGSVTTIGSQSYGDAVQFKLNALTATSTGGGNITFNATVGGLNLTVNTAGTTVFNAAVGVLSLTTDAAGTTVLNGGAVSTGGGQSYGDPITLGAATTLSATSVTFGNTVNGAFDLAVNAPATAFNGAVGGFTPLASLSINSSGMTLLNGGSVLTSGSQFYRNPITLGAGTTLTSTGAGDITSAGTVNGAFGLAVNTSGTTSFNAAVGGSTALASLSTTGPTAINGNLVVTTGSQTYNGIFTLGADTTLTSTGAGNIIFGNTVSGAYGLTVNTAGTTAFNGEVTPNSLTTDAPGTTLLNCGTVGTSGSQTYGDAVTLGSNTMLYSGVGNITFASTVDGGVGLTLSASATTAFNGPVGRNVPLASLNTNQRGGSTLLNGGSVLTFGSQVYYDQVVLGADATLTGTGIALLGASGTSVSGNNHALTLVNSDDSVLNFYANSTSGGLSSLVLNGSRPLTVSDTLSVNTVIVNNGATLAGNATILGAVAVSSGGTLSPGSSSIGTLTISNSLSLGGTALMELSPAGATNDQVRGISLLTYGGTLQVTNLDGTPLAASNKFKLFQAASYGGAFTNFLFPPLSNGLAWDTSKLALDGSIAVIQPPIRSRITAIQSLAPHTIQLAGTGVASQVYYIWASTNLSVSQWWLLGITNSANSGQIGFTDLTATNNHRFYRLAQ